MISPRRRGRPLREERRTSGRSSGELAETGVVAAPPVTARPRVKVGQTMARRSLLTTVAGAPQRLRHQPGTMPSVAPGSAAAKPRRRRRCSGRSSVCRSAVRSRRRHRVAGADPLLAPARHIAQQGSRRSRPVMSPRAVNAGRGSVVRRITAPSPVPHRPASSPQGIAGHRCR